MTAQREHWLDHRAEMAREAPEYVELSRRWQVARKAYTCIHCRKPIRPYTRYLAIAYKLDGKFGYDRSHDPSAFCAVPVQ